MVEIDWTKFVKIAPDFLSEHEKHDLCKTVLKFIPDIELEKEYLIHFIRIIQVILQFKCEQVESLTNELDEVATLQGKEEGIKLQQYTDEIERLQEEVEYYRKLDESSSKFTYASNEELKREIVKLEMQNEELLEEIKIKEKDLKVEKEEVEQYASQIAKLEREKKELLRELKTLQDEGFEKRSSSLKDSPEFGAKKREDLLEVIKQKNQHISQLLDDVEVVEEENLSLRTKLTSVKEELSETTAYITEITTELSKLKHLNKENEEINAESKDKIKSLMYQIEELVEEKKKYNTELDEYILTFNAKIDEYNNVIEMKEDEILKLQGELKNLYSSNELAVSNADCAMLNKKISDQEKEIKLLQQELQQATEEINNSADLIEQLKKNQTQIVLGSHKCECTTAVFEEKIKVLEEKLTYAEEDSQIKAKEMSDLVIQIREYESGVFGLSEAITKVKKLETIIEDKDFQIEKLVEICNNLEIKLDNFEIQNAALREKLGFTLFDEVDTSGITLRLKKDEDLIKNLKFQLDQKEEELLKTKLKNRKIIKYIKTVPHKVKTVFPEKLEEHKIETEKPDFSKKLHLIVKENDALRKGMHEILESIRQQDSLGTVEVQSNCLERLLEALDSRHVSGWYHPAMRLQAQLNTEEGKNEELRNQIRYLKTEEKKIANALQNAYLKIQTLENDLLTPRYEEEKIKHSSPEPEDKEKSNFEKPTYTAQETKIVELESNLQKLKLKCHTKMVEIEKKENDFLMEKEQLKEKISELEFQITQYINQNQNPDLTKVVNLNSQIVVLERKVNFLKNCEYAERKKNEKLKLEFIEVEEKFLQNILRLQSEKAELLHKIEELEKSVMNGVTQEKFTCLVNELTDIRAKYQKIVAFGLLEEDNGKVKILEEELILLQNEKLEIMEELKVLKEKLIAADILISDETVTNEDFISEVSTFAAKLAACEIRELNEIQKSSHLEKMNSILKSQQEELEARNKQLLEKIVKLTEENEAFQKIERELRVKLLSQISEEETFTLQEKVEFLEKRNKDLMMEKENIKELFEISQGQCRALQEWKNSDKILLISLEEQVMALQATDDDKATISRLSHEITMSKLLSSELTKKNSDLSVQLTRSLAQTLGLEVKLAECRNELFKINKKHVTQIQYLYDTISELRNIYGVSAAFRDLEDIFKKKVALREQKEELNYEKKNLKNKIREYTVKKEEMEKQLESLEDLKMAIKGDTKNLILWHNKITELKLKEAKAKRENEYLIDETAQLQKCMKRLYEEIDDLEQNAIEKEKEWESKQIFWEEHQREMCQLLLEKGINKESRVLCDAGMNTEKVTNGLINVDVKETNIFQELEVQENEITDTKHQEQWGKEIIKKEEKQLIKTNGQSKNIEVEEHPSKEKVEHVEREAFRVMIESLQNIIKQKEETILRYQNLLKESREEYAKSFSKLQDELKNVNNSLLNQRKTCNKLKNVTRTNRLAKENIPVVVEKYLIKIQELKEELRDCQINLSNMSKQIYSNHQEVEKWRNLAEERLLQIEEIKQRLEQDYKDEIENYKDEIKKCQLELERLNRTLESHQTYSSTEDINEHKMKRLQVKILETENEQINIRSDQLSDCTFDKPSKQKQAQTFREVESLKRQLKFAKDESSRLREQIRLLQLQSTKKPRSSGSATTRSTSKSSLKEENLFSKIKNLEELLIMSKEKEKELTDINEKKLKSVEEVARWNEKKKCQQVIENLTIKLKEKETELEIVKNKNESFRNILYKCERDKIILEDKLKSVKGGSGGFNAKIERLTEDKKYLEATVDILKTKLEEQLRHSGGIGAAILEEKLEEQERKLANFELASRGQFAVVEEIEKLKVANSNLEKLNLKLESENLSLQLQLEKEKSETKYLIDKVKHLQRVAEEKKHAECGEKILRRTIEKLKNENKKLIDEQKEVKTHGLVDKIRKELLKLKEEYNLLNTKYMDARDRNIVLEDELKSYRYRLELLEEKDIAEIFTKARDIQSNFQLTQELSEIKAKLNEKNFILGKVKALLIKAAAKEKALNEEVLLLRNSISKSSSHIPELDKMN